MNSASVLIRIVRSVAWERPASAWYSKWVRPESLWSWRSRRFGNRVIMPIVTIQASSSSGLWEAAPISLSASAAGTPLVYDFGGFASRYFCLEYRTPDAGRLAAKVAALLSDTEPVHQHASRGLDHGAWVPLKVMYPWADVPVLQLSMPTHDPARLLDLGVRLRELRNEGVLIIGSGYMTHGLPFLNRSNFYDNAVPEWSAEFDHLAAEAIARRDIDMLANYEGKAPGMPYAHPTVEHYTPLFITLGAASSLDDPITTTIEGFQFGLAKRSLQVG